MFPNFLCIGAQKGGTTWLHDNLETHPEIWLPPIKEVHYLDGRSMSVGKCLFSSTKRARKARAHLWAQLRALPRGGRREDLAWAARYCFGARNDAWYRSLFPNFPGKLVGEICPGYATLRGDGVARVHRLMPEARIIYLLRNPMERSWSYATQYFTSPRWKGRYGSLDSVPPNEIRTFLESDLAGHSDYMGAIEAWTRYYGERQMLIGFYDELAADPRQLLKRILEFLEIDSSDNAIPAGVAANRHPTRGSAVPTAFRSYLAELHRERLEALHARLASPWTAAWLEQARRALAPHVDQSMPA